jgi:hypothetical protein
MALRVAIGTVWARVRSVSIYRKVGYGSALALAFFVTPLVVMAAQGSSHHHAEMPATTDDAGEPLHTHGPAEDTGILSDEGGSAAHTSVKVNGQDVLVPANGSVHKHITSDNTTTQVDVDSRHKSTGSSNHSSTSITINNQSHP